MKYITPEEIITYLPRNIRQSENKADLVSHIIRAYKSLEIPQDQNYIEDIIAVDNTNIPIPEKYDKVIAINYVEGEHVYAVYPTSLQSAKCGDVRRCRECDLTYSIINETLRLPKSGTYIIIYNQLFSEQLRIFNDPVLIDYLKWQTIYNILFERALSSDITAQLLTHAQSNAAMLYPKARGSVIMKAIRLKEHTLNLTQINMNIDEFNKRYYTYESTRR